MADTLTCPQETFQLSGNVTVDSTSNLFLDDAFACCVRVPGLPQKHDTRAMAVTHSLSSAGHVNIVGHGDVGIIGTGCGATKGHDPAKFLDIQHLGSWVAQHQIQSLTLLGCNTGAEDAGADLLFALAQAIGVEVRAPAGFVHIGAGCDDFYLDPSNRRLQTATKDHRPDPIPAGSEANTFDPSQVMLVMNGEFAALAMDHIPHARLYSMVSGQSNMVQEWTGTDTRHPIRFVDFERPLLRGVPAAFETGSVDITVVSNGKEIRRSFRVYNNRLLQDTAFRQVFYRANIGTLLKG